MLCELLGLPEMYRSIFGGLESQVGKFGSWQSVQVGQASCLCGGTPAGSQREEHL